MSRRLQTRDYASPGVYFVTICANFRRSVFGKVIGSDVQLNPLGEIARQTWVTIPSHFEGVNLPAFVVMPNHVHGIVEIGTTGWRSMLRHYKEKCVLPHRWPPLFQRSFGRLRLKLRDAADWS